MSLPVHLTPVVGAVGDVVTVDGDEAHHAVAVRRLRVGERVQLVDGAGRRGEGEVVETGKRVFRVRLDDVAVEPEPTPRVVVVQALPKGRRGELAVEVLTEVGAAQIVPWAAARSVAVWRGERAEKSLAKWRVTAREAAKQARRAWFPEVTPMATTGDVAALAAGVDVALVLHEDAAGSLASVEVPVTGTVMLVVGPEGGLTDDEVAALTEAGAQVVRLGAEVLRTSTAGLAAASALLSRTPRWGV